MITIVIPYFNREPYLLHTLQTISASTLRPTHLILVDNGSTDGSASVCRDFAEKNNAPDFNVVLTEESKRGACCARNRGLSLCTTPYVYFFDSDDDFDKDFLSDIEPVLQSEKPDVLAVTTRQVQHGAPKVRHFRTTAEPAAQLLVSHLATQSMVFRTDFLRTLGGWDERLSVWDDWELGLRVLLHHPEMRWFTKRPYHKVHVRPDSITGGSYAGNADKLLLTLRAAADEISDPATRRALYYRHCIVEGQLAHLGNAAAARACRRQKEELFANERSAFGNLLRRLQALGVRGAWRLAWLAWQWGKKK